MVFDENLLTMSEAAKRFPPINGHRPHRNSIYRWATDGVDGVVLESVVIGRRLCTTAEAIERFCQQLSEKRIDQRAKTPAPKLRCRTSAQKRASKAQAKRRLAELGI